MDISYQDAIEIIEGLSNFGSKLGLDRIKRLLDRLDNPQDKIPVIHIGGTNGKGSVSRMISFVLTRAGYKVGLYTSPHLHSIRERIQINNRLIDKDSFVNTLKILLPYIEELTDEDADFYLTEFEILTAMAFLYFYMSKVDVVVLEVGLGGRLDATNVVNNVLVSVITNVDWDHMDRLGNTLSLIGREKAGIIKRGVPVVTGARGEGLDVIADTAKKLDSNLYILGRDFSADWYVLSQAGTEMGFRNEIKREELFTGLRGTYQVDNMSIAMMGLEIIKNSLHFSDSSLFQGLAETFWPGRMEIVSRDPLVLLDGAHNKGGAEKFASSLKILFDIKPTLVVGMLKDKDSYGIISSVLSLAKEDVVVTSPRNSRALDAEALGKVVKDLGGNPIVVPDVKESVKMAIQLDSDFISVMGSLYVVAEAREVFVNGIERD